MMRRPILPTKIQSELNYRVEKKAMAAFEETGGHIPYSTLETGWTDIILRELLIESHRERLKLELQLRQTNQGGLEDFI